MSAPWPEHAPSAQQEAKSQVGKSRRELLTRTEFRWKNQITTKKRRHLIITAIISASLPTPAFSSHMPLRAKKRLVGHMPEVNNAYLCRDFHILCQSIYFFISFLKNVFNRQHVFSNQKNPNNVYPR